MKMFISVLAAILTAAVIFAGVYYFSVARPAERRQREAAAEKSAEVMRQQTEMVRRGAEMLKAAQKNLEEEEARDAKKPGTVNPK